MNISCCSAAAKGGTKKGKTVVGHLNLIDPGGCAYKTNKPLQSRTSDFETDQRALTKTLLYQNDASFSKDYFQHQANRKTVRRPHQHPSWKQSVACKCDLCSNLLLDADILPTILHPFCVSWFLFREGVARFLRSVRTGDRFILLALGRANGSIFSQGSVVCGDCKWTAGGSTEHQMPSPAGLVPAASRNGTPHLKVTPDWRWEERKWAFWTWFTPMKTNPGNHLASKLLLLN